MGATGHRLVNRLLVMCVDVMACAFIAAVLIAGMPEVAYAYVDPSVMTYAIQAVAGAAVALSAVVGVAFRRTRSWLFARLGIDSEGKRERDSAWAEFEKPDESLLALGAVQANRVSGAGREPIGEGHGQGDGVGEGSRHAPTSWTQRFAMALLVSFMASCTLLFVGPLEVLGSSSDFLFTPRQVAPIVLAETLGASLVCALALSCLRGRVFKYALGVVFAIGVGFYVQALALNRGLPLADGSEVEWAKYYKITLVSSVVWVMVIAAALIAARVAGYRSSMLLAIVSAALIIVQGVGVGSVLVTNSSKTLVDGSPAAQNAVVTEEGLFDVSAKENVIVFVLDTYDTADFTAALEKDPTIADSLTGFTWYDNVCGAMIPTRYGIPFLLTGERPHEDETFHTYKRERYARSPLLSDLTDAGFSSGVYSDNLMVANTTPEIAKDKVVDLAFNLTNDPVAELDVVGTMRAMTTVALYRSLPWVLKPGFWFDTDAVVSEMVREGSQDPEKTEYLRDDAAYYAKLESRGLSTVERGERGSFRFIHMSGTHKPYNVNTQGRSDESGEVTKVDQAIGTMRIAEYYLDQLKQMGLYDGATIIFTADHGKWYLTDKFLKSPSSPYILAKPSQGHEEASKPLVTSHAPVMHDDVVATVADAIGADLSGYAGRSLFSYRGDEDPHATRYYLSTQSDGKHDVSIVEYAIEGDVMNLDNWKLTGRSWNAKT